MKFGYNMSDRGDLMMDKLLGIEKEVEKIAVCEHQAVEKIPLSVLSSIPSTTCPCCHRTFIYNIKTETWQEKL